jgi:uncharacterized protein YoxC
VSAAAIGFAVAALVFAAATVSLALALVSSERVRANLRVVAEHASSLGVQVQAQLEQSRQLLAEGAARLTESDARHERVIAYLKTEIADLEEAKDAGRDRGSVAARLRSMLVKLEDAADRPVAAPAAAPTLVLLGGAVGRPAAARPAGGGGPG